MKYKKIQKEKCMTKVNKKEFINILSKKTKLSTDKCETINNILERHFLLGKKNKEQIINDIEKELEVSRISSEEIKNKKTFDNYVFVMLYLIYGKGGMVFMMINKAYKFRLYPNDMQKILIHKTFGCN